MCGALFGLGAVYPGYQGGGGSVGNFDYTFDAYGFENDHDFGVRPVVCLDSGVLEEQVPKIEKLRV